VKLYIILYMYILLAVTVLTDGFLLHEWWSLVTLNNGKDTNIN